MNISTYRRTRLRKIPDCGLDVSRIKKVTSFCWVYRAVIRLEVLVWNHSLCRRIISLLNNKCTKAKYIWQKQTSRNCDTLQNWGYQAASALPPQGPFHPSKSRTPKPIPSQYSEHEFQPFFPSFRKSFRSCLFSNSCLCFPLLPQNSILDIKNPHNALLLWVCINDQSQTPDPVERSLPDAKFHNPAQPSYQMIRKQTITWVTDDTFTTAPSSRRSPRSI